MKYLLLTIILLGCSTSPKPGCIITKIECKKDQCRLIFDDNSEFFIPKSMLEYIKVNDNICKKG